MSRLLASASNQYLVNTSTSVVSGYPFALSCWIYMTTVTGVPFGVLQDAQNNGHRFQIAGGANLTATSKTTAASSATHATTLATGTWYHCAAMFLSATSRSVWLNGAGKVTDVTSIPYDDPALIVMDSVRAGSLGNGGQDFNGRVAECAIWNITSWPGATDADKAASFEAIALPALAKGYSPQFFRPGLLAYWPLIRADNNRMSTVHLTAFGSPTVAEHVPTIKYPAPPGWVVAPQVAAGGLSIPVAMHSYRRRRAA